MEFIAARRNRGVLSQPQMEQQSELPVNWELVFEVLITG